MRFDLISMFFRIRPTQQKPMLISNKGHVAVVELLGFGVYEVYEAFK